MPRLGGDNTPQRKRPPFSAYLRRLPKPNLRNIFLALAAFFLLRNLLRNDYREEEMKHLRPSNGIEQVIGKTKGERAEYLKENGNDVVRLKDDIAYLLNELHASRKNVRDAGRESALKEMDHLHMVKRKKAEEQLLKEHPDFVPSRRVNKGESGTMDAVVE